ncbi:hypothetical protein CDAR_613821 [Caerostris darwini]|uniref:Uncharacterized protein n=1 Tax=Caerostris darwini TaxID=1538125 RepID=A0AAV4MIM3_9ARAC|nr:hypothetical protein CDAR_613821 [Caerostris darwini]
MLPALVFGMWRKFSPIGKLLYHRSARCACSDSVNTYLLMADNSTPRGSALFVVVVVAAVRFDSGCLVLGVNLSGMSVDGYDKIIMFSYSTNFPLKYYADIPSHLPPRSNNKLHYSLHIFLTHIRPHFPRTQNTVLLAKNNTRALFFLQNLPVIFGLITDRKKEEKCQVGPPTASSIMISSPQVLPDSFRTCPSQRSASVWSIRPYFWNRCPLLTTRRKSHPGLSPVFICIELNRGQARRKRVAACLQKG